MTSPVKIDAGLREVPLPSSRPVALRVLRIAVAISLPWVGGVWAYSLPLAVVDHGRSPARTHLVVGLEQAMAVAFAIAIVMNARRHGAAARTPEPR